jgi:hypothetical protein
MSLFVLEAFFSLSNYFENDTIEKGHKDVFVHCMHHCMVIHKHTYVGVVGALCSTGQRHALRMKRANTPKIQRLSFGMHFYMYIAVQS